MVWNSQRIQNGGAFWRESMDVLNGILLKDEKLSYACLQGYMPASLSQNLQVGGERPLGNSKTSSRSPGGTDVWPWEMNSDFQTCRCFCPGTLENNLWPPVHCALQMLTKAEHKEEPLRTSTEASTRHHPFPVPPFFPQRDAVIYCL